MDGETSWLFCLRFGGEKLLFKGKSFKQCGKGHAMMKKHSDLYKETIISQNSMINELIKSFN